MAETIKEYSQGEEVRLTVELEDESGVGRVRAIYYPVKQHGSNEIDYSEAPIELYGYGGGQARAAVVLSGRVENQRPGEFFCNTLLASDELGNQSRVESPANAPRFRVVEKEDSPRDYEGPRVLGIGPFE